MKKYYVRTVAQPNGDHEVHREDCNYLPKLENRHYLGKHTNCYSAVAAAKLIYAKSNGCYYCSNECHTS